MSKVTDKFEKVMREFADGKLKSSSGDIVTDRNQALAIAYSESGLQKGIMIKSHGEKLKEEGAHTRNTNVEIDPKELEMGMKIELEHGNDAKVAKEIALDHLAEDKEYYTHLAEMEKKHRGNEPKEKGIIQVKKAMMKKLAGMARPSLVTFAQLKRLADPPAEYDRKYKLHGHRRVHGLDIAVENAAGSVRSGKDSDGRPWETKMNFDYGRIVGTKSTDSEAVDVYIGPDETAEEIYVVHQNDPFTGRYDEDKCMMQFPSKEAAIEGYLSQYDRPDFLGAVSVFTVPEFLEALKCRKGGMLYKSPLQKAVRLFVRRMEPDRG